MPTGRVKMFNTERKFGFAQPSDGGRDVFVRASDVEDAESLRPGDIIEYELGENDEGIHATNVRVTERAPEDNPAGRVVSGAPPTWDELEAISRDLRQDRRQRRRRR